MKIPIKFSKKWMLFLGIYTIVIWIIFVSNMLIQGNLPNLKNGSGTLLVSFVLSLICCFFGYIGMKYLFYLSSAGLFTGIVVMTAVMIMGRSGWEDLIGPILMLEFFAFGLVIGLMVHIICFFIKNRKGSL